MTTPLPYRQHDHAHCVEHALADARDICKRSGARLTPIRERVLQLIWQSHQPLGAYELLAALSQDGHQAAPPTVYRALDFLQQHGLVHRIASLNAFVGCPHAGRAHTGCFLICQSCRNVLELTDKEISAAIEQQSQRQGFKIDHVIVEIAGQCPACQQAAATS